MTQVTLDTLVQAAILGDRVVSFPTDTVPALAVQPQQAELIFQLKQRSPDKPLILMGASAESLWPFVEGTVEELEIWSQMARQYWPGALTLVLPASEKVPQAMNPNDPTTIGLRVPNAEISRTILQRTGPLATTSANLSGQPPLLTMADIDAEFPQVLTLHPGELKVTRVADRVPSTVIKWNQQGTWKVLRQGAVRLKFQ
ncbi:MAG: L-threonylcarbamoyladenylate synthase [Lyngbya sp.]|nr:L-threonylcarbamoyladenylate synthase [Lyngbya sp.]